MAQLSSLIHHFRGPLILLSAGPLAALLWGEMFRSPAASDPMPAASSDASPAAAHKTEWQGVASCAATACHGGNGVKGSKGSEYTTWSLYDNHTKAYEVLSNERSQNIEKNLHRLKSVKDAHAEQDQLCLRCHAMNAGAGPQRESFVRGFGIGCESCHGPAQKWLGVHYANDWKSKSDADKLKLDFQPMKKLVDRAKLCASCHIGDAEKEVNHDLIAAGHPRLNFEFGAFQAIMPRHWREEGENARPDFEARAWAVGQVVSAQAALALVAHRARPNSQSWPEFAEYDCFACHHDLHEPCVRQKPVHNAERAPGSLPWGTWYYATLPQALRGSAGKGDAQLLNILGALKKEMQKPFPDPTRVAERAREGNKELGRLLGDAEKAHYERTALESLFSSIRADYPKIAVKNWDGKVQVYLALAALYNALGDIDPGHRDPAWRDELKAWAKGLEFHKGYDSPHNPTPKSNGETREQAPQ